MNEEVGRGRAAQVAEFQQYVKDQKEAWDKVWEAVRARQCALNASDQKYYEELGKEQRAILKKHLENVGQSESGAPAGQVLK